MLIILLMVSLACAAFDGYTGRRIYGGRETDIRSFPYQVQIVPAPRNPAKLILYSTCGGTMLGERVVLTAKHCFRKRKSNPKNYFVRAGTSYRNGRGGSLHRIMVIISHPDTRRKHSTQDLAIILVDPPFEFGRVRHPIPIGISPPRSGDKAIATGWGRNSLKRERRPSTLRSVRLEVISQRKCNRRTRWRGMLDHGNFCAGKAGKTAACKGDSGGPLVVDGKLVGIVSWGTKACAEKGRPSVFTNVSAYLPWIQEVTDGLDVEYA